MLKRFVLLFAPAALVLLPGFAARAGAERVQESVVKIQVGYRSPDYFQPWDMGYQNTKFGSGFIVEGKRIMTNAHVIGDQVYIQVLKVGDTKKYTARVEYVAHDCEVALLKVEDESFFDGTVPVRFGGVPLQRDRVAVYGFPMGGEVLSITEGIVSRVEVQNYSHSQRDILAVQIDAAINPGNSGGPVFKGGEVVGISFQTYASSQNIGYIVPVPVIKRFYADIKDGKYDGYPMLGVYYEKLENPALREYLKLKPKQGGILVTKSVYQSSAWGALREGDVIMSIAGIPIEQDGTVEFRKDERVKFTWLLNSFQTGDKAEVGILRDGVPVKLTLKLAPTPYLVPLMQYDTRPTYLEFAGFVFMPLTYNYMAGWNWNEMDPKFRVLFTEGLRTPEKKQVVFINQVLPDDINVGYQDISRAIVERVNGKPIGEIADLVAALKAPQGGFHVLEMQDFAGKGTRIVLDAKKTAEANAQILKRFSIPSDRSEDLR